MTTWLIEETKRNDLTPWRSKAIVRMMKEVAATEEKALQRATELTRCFADQTLEMLNRAKAGAQPSNLEKG
jgi:hypothetical protein